MMGLHYSLKGNNQDTTKTHGRLGGICQTPGSLQTQPCHMPDETGVQLMCATSYDKWCSDLDTDQTSTVQTCDRTDQNGKKNAQTSPGLNIAHQDKRTQIILAMERTTVIDIISNARKMKWFWTGFKDDLWTSRVTTWRPYYL